MYVAYRKGTGVVVGASFSPFDENSFNMTNVLIGTAPVQSLSKFSEDDEAAGLGISGMYKDKWEDLTKYTVAENKLIIDMETGEAISSQVHSMCGLDEQFGIIRDQITRMLNGDITASEDFIRMNNIAIEEIEKGQIEKEALDAENN